MSSAFNGNYPIPEPRMDWDAIRRARAVPWVDLGNEERHYIIPDKGCDRAKQRGHMGRCIECPFPECFERSVL